MRYSDGIVERNFSMFHFDGIPERIFLKTSILKTPADDKKACKISKQACRGNGIIYFYMVFLIVIIVSFYNANNLH